MEPMQKEHRGKIDSSTQPIVKDALEQDDAFLIHSKGDSIGIQIDLFAFH